MKNYYLQNPTDKMLNTLNRILLFSLIFLVPFLCPFFSSGQQNLVPNGSFEEYMSCPSGFTDFTVTDWYIPTGGTSDYFNACNSSAVSVPINLMGYQEAHSGSAYCGFVSGFDSPNENAREYIQTQLLTELEAGKEYQFTGFFNLADSSRYCIKNLGIVFSNYAIGGSFGTPIVFSPIQVFPYNLSLCNTDNWVEININYLAQGGEKYLTIGLFFDDANSSIGLVNPLIQEFGYYYVDDICVKEITIGQIGNIFTPNNDGINDMWEFESFSERHVTIVNRWGNIVYEATGYSLQWNGENCADGVYYYRILSNETVKSGFIELIR